ASTSSTMYRTLTVVIDCPFRSVLLRDELVIVVGLPIVPLLLALRQLDLRLGYALVVDLAEQVRDDVQPRAALVVRSSDVPWRPRRIRRREHVVAGPRIVVPAAVRLEIHRRQLPRLPAVVDAPLEPPRLLFRAHLEPVLQQDDAGVDHQLLECR